jgi:uncharacterized protein YecE (DUF72 family)
MKPGRIHIGTSGWNYKHWKGVVYPEGLKDADQFSIYAKTFDTVEINNSFYHLPPFTTFQQWGKKAPANFIFAVKASRFITHMKKLKESEEALDTFLKNAEGLQKHLGPVLFQLPPSWNINRERFESFLKKLPTGYRYVFEFRNTSWYDPSIYHLLHEYNCAFCIYELEYHISPFKITADFVYIRLHGPGKKYAGSYTNAILKQWAQRCKEWAAEGKDVFIYFDNDQLGYAAFNAKALKEMV